MQGRSMKRARDIREQLVGLMERVEIAMETCGDDDVALRKAITAGYFSNVAQLFKPSEGCYKTVKARHSVYIHPGSGAIPIVPEARALLFSVSDVMASLYLLMLPDPQSFAENRCDDRIDVTMLALPSYTH
jgi:hypothetical protein